MKRGVWIPMSEGLPEMPHEVFLDSVSSESLLVWTESKYVSYVRFIKDEDGVVSVHTEDSERWKIDSTKITHYMYIPEIPKD
jgi:uncharacterized protein YfbU (UPF0304 family)